MPSSVPSGLRQEGRERPVVREYRQLAPHYDRRWARYVRETSDLTREALGDRAGGGRLLDVGCGTGTFLGRLAAEASSAVLHGTDLSPDMLRVARRRLPPGVRLARAGAEALPYQEGAFDTVTSVSVLHFVETPGDALREAYRVLRPGGTVVVTDWCRDYAAMKLLDVWLRWREPGHGATRSTGEVVAMMEEAGFRRILPQRRRVAGWWGILAVRGVR